MKYYLRTLILSVALILPGFSIVSAQDKPPSTEQPTAKKKKKSPSDAEATPEKPASKPASKKPSAKKSDAADSD